MLASHAGRGTLRFLVWVGVFAALVLSSSAASAYPWMIRHNYAGCVPCHADPSGAGGVLTEYGRAQSDNILRMRYGAPPGDEASKTARFLWGVPTPEWLLLGGSFRDGILVNKTGNTPMGTRFLEMQTDLKAQITASRFRAYGSLGFLHEGGLEANITHNLNNNLVSREHWLGVDLGEDKQFLLRAGRINLPFGLRVPEHTMWVRSETRTDFDKSQQDGIALAYTGSKVRFEVMGILGNYQINPDIYRERGYSGYVEFSPTDWVGVGVSSLTTFGVQDPYSAANHVLRMAHGAFVRMAPTRAVVIMAEADALIRIENNPTKTTVPGFAGMLQGDFEPVQGLHLMVTGEFLDGSPIASGPSFGAWGSVVWFFAPHADIRFDAIWQRVENAGLRTQAVSLLPQAHIFF